jgi:hypothetical protein
MVHCNFCRKQGDWKYCNCKVTAYCSDECKQKDEKIHVLFCSDHLEKDVFLFAKEVSFIDYNLRTNKNFYARIYKKIPKDSCALYRSTQNKQLDDDERIENPEIWKYEELKKYLTENDYKALTTEKEGVKKIVFILLEPTGSFPCYIIEI